MRNRPIDAVVLTAALQRSLFGERVYRDVTLRGRDGGIVSLERVTVAGRLGDALTPGREGRFYLHDAMGAQVLHAFRPASGPTRIACPMLAERAFALLALIGLVMVSSWLAKDGLLPLVPLTLTVAATAAWATCRGCREAVLHDLKYEGRVAAAGSHRQAVFRSHA